MTLFETEKAITPPSDSGHCIVCLPYSGLLYLLKKLFASSAPRRPRRHKQDQGDVKNTDQELPDPVDHPVIRTHPETGRKAIFVNRAFTESINELSKDESDNILNILFNQAERPEHQIRYRWATNDLAFWDNRCVMHYAMFDYYPELREGHRVTIIGDRPY